MVDLVQTVPSRIDPRVTRHGHAVARHTEETESVAVLFGNGGDRSKGPKRGAPQDPARPTEPSGSLRQGAGNEDRRHAPGGGLLGQGRPDLALGEHDHMRLNGIEDRTHHLGEIPRQVRRDVGVKIPVHGLGGWREERKDDV